MFDFDKNNNNSFWNTGSSSKKDHGWGFGGSKDRREIDEIYGIADREGRSFWDVLSDLLFR